MSKLTPLDLGDRLLWADGTISVSPDFLPDYIFKLGQRGKLEFLSVTELTEAVTQYNQLADHPISVKTDVSQVFPPEWVLPERYKYLDLDDYLIKLADRINHDELYETRLERLAIEITLFKQLGLEPIIRVLIYVVDSLIEQGAVWGVGRGSSCSSYLLYLLGLHEVDPVKYGIEITDFIRTKGD